MELTQKRLKELLDYDPKTGIFTWKYANNNRKAGSKAGYKAKDGYIAISIDSKRYLAHRLVWLFVYGHFPKYNIDHINRIRDDNRIENLREANQSYNQDIELTQKRLKELLDYDPETGIFIWKYARRNGVKVGCKAGYKDNGYIIIGIDNKDYRAHRLAWFFVYGYFPKYNIEHINRIKDDNRIENLREINQSYNQDIELTQKRLKELLDYDPKTGIFIWKFMHSGIKADSKAGSKRKDGYIAIRIDNKDYLAHRLAWFFVYGHFPKYDIDHINRKKDDNRIENLRDITQNYNQINSKTQINNTSGIRGVFYDKRDRKWRTYIGISRKQRNLGSYDNMLDAIKARFVAEQKYGWMNLSSELSDAYNYILKHDPSYILKHNPNEEQIDQCLRAISNIAGF